MTNQTLSLAQDHKFEPAFATIESLADALAKRQISSEEITRDFLLRIARLDGKLHSFVATNPEQSLQAARSADAARAAGRATGVLFGIPIAVKDIFDCQGYPTRAGSNALHDRLPEVSASAVRRLEAAGMVVLGKTHMVEFAFGGWGTNPVAGTPWNPWDLVTHRCPGGSSSGSAVAVAAGLAPAAIGTDTGGSIRTPAAWCGIVGMKTSKGLIGRHGIVPLAPTHDTAGPLTRSVRDAGLLLDALAGFDALDPETHRTPAIAPMKEIEAGVKGLTIGILGEEHLSCVEPGVGQLFAAALRDLKALGAQLKEVHLPSPMANYLRDGGDIMSAESYAHLGRYVEPSDSPVEPVIRERILRGRDISTSTYIRLIEQRRLAQAEFLVALGQVDALVLPSCPAVPIPVAEVVESLPPNVFGRFVNFLDLASLTVPIGVTEARLPAGMQIATRLFEDAMALRIGRALETLRGSLVQRPEGL
jgi:aspartyl-tRNA(Asn)/glutamyl-tRNA(Gln) amidotransferase subunit A